MFDSVLDTCVCSVICTVTLCYVKQQTHSGFWHIPYSVFSGICWYIKSYSALLRFRPIQAYSTPCVTLAYWQRCYILCPSIFRTGQLSKPLWKVDQTYSEPCQRAIIQVYSGIFTTFCNACICRNMAYSESSINCNPTHIQNPVIFKTWHNRTKNEVLH